MFLPCPVQEADLSAGVAPDRGRPRIWCRRRWLYIVLAVQPESLDDFKGVLLVLVYVGMRGLKERGGSLHRCVRRFDRPVALEA